MPLAIAVDVLRATSTICAALAAGFSSVDCVAEIDDALARRAAGVLLAGERDCVRIEGFDLGNSPAEVAAEPRFGRLVLSTTNGTRLLVAAADRSERVLVGSLANLGAVAAAVRALAPECVAILCAGVEGAFALDDAYCAGRIVEALDGERTDAAIGAAVIATAWPDPLAGLNARTYGPPGLEADIEFCAQVDLLDTVPRFSRMVGTAAEIVA